MPTIIGGPGSKSVCELALKATLASAGSNAIPISARFYYLRTLGAANDDKVAIAAAFLAGTWAAYIAAANSRLSSASANLRYIDDAIDPVTIVPLAGSGAIVTDSAPSCTAIFMEFGTNIRGKKYRGGKHFAGVNEVDTTGDVLTGAGLTRWQALQTALLVPIVVGPNTYTPSVVTFAPITQIKTNPTTVIVNPITAIVLDINVGTMKRRKAKRTV